MDGVLLIHAKTGHILFQKAYTEGFGLQLKGEADGSNVSAPKDPLIASMLLANFLCAFYTNVLSLVDESALPPDASMTDLLRQPLQSLDTGANGPMVFFHRHTDTNVLCALFLKRALLVDAPDPAAAPATPSSLPTDVNETDAPSSSPAADSHERRFQQCGDWLAQQTLTTFVDQFRGELAARPFRASTKTFKPFLSTFETLYTATFSNYLLQSAVDHLAHRWHPKWMYVIYSEEFCRGMDKAEGATAGAVAAAAAPVAPKPKFARPSSIRVADASMHGDIGIVPSSVGPTPSTIAPSFLPHPPATPAPAHAVASRSDGGASGSNSFFAARPVSTRTLHPFRPKVRRWWHFGSGGGKDAAAPPLFYAQLGRTTCFYQFKGDNPARVEEEEKTSADPPPKKPSAPPSSSVDLSSVPSADALRQLVALVHQAGVLLAQPTEVADQLNWMEVQLKPSSLPAGKAKSTTPQQQQQQQAQKLWVLRIQDLLLCFPTSSNSTDDLQPSASSTSSAPCSFPALLSSFHPFLACLAVHYACVSAIHERQYRTLQKNMEKQAATKAATAAAAAK